jgi:hypothetical protein
MIARPVYYRHLAHPVPARPSTFATGTAHSAKQPPARRFLHRHPLPPSERANAMSITNEGVASPDHASLPSGHPAILHKS